MHEITFNQNKLFYSSCRLAYSRTILVLIPPSLLGSDDFLFLGDLEPLESLELFPTSFIRLFEPKIILLPFSLLPLELLKSLFLSGPLLSLLLLNLLNFWLPSDFSRISSYCSIAGIFCFDDDDALDFLSIKGLEGSSFAFTGLSFSQHWQQHLKTHAQ